MAKEVWIEGTFAGEIQLDERESGLYSDDDIFERDGEEDWLDDEWDDDLDDLYDLDDSEDADECAFGDGNRKRSMHNKVLGRRGERAAARYLEQRGYEILELNYSCPFGEADIIARDGETLTFVEVKTRTGVARGFPSEAVDEQKRARYERIAGWYLHDYDAVDIPVRFDVIAIMVIAENRAFLRHYVNAFGTRF